MDPVYENEILELQRAVRKSEYALVYTWSLDGVRATEVGRPTITQLADIKVAQEQSMDHLVKRAIKQVIHIANSDEPNSKQCFACPVRDECPSYKQ